MNIRKEKLCINNKHIEVTITLTRENDYIGVANFIGSNSIALYRSSNIKLARQLAINRLLNLENLILDNDKNYKS